MRKKYLIVFAMLVVYTMSRDTAGEFVNEDAKLGINLNSVIDWAPNWYFLDVFKEARPWIPQRLGIWDTGESIPLRPDGYPSSLPNGLWAATLCEVGQGGNYPGGLYTLFYEGQGAIDIGFDGFKVSEVPGRITVNVTPSNAGILVRLIQTNPTNPIRNMRLVTPGFENTYEQQIFTPRFLGFLTPFSVLRFSSWQRVGNSVVSSWSERTTPTKFSQASRQGVALEYMIELCNRTKKDPWFCMSHLADDNYILNFAAMVRDNLDPSLRAYIEVSNEVWNSIFSQAHYFEQQGLALGLSSAPFEARLRAYAKRSVEVFNLFEFVFGGTDRLVRVIASQHGNPWTGATTLDWNNAYAKTDALAIAPYFGHDLGNPSKGLNTPNQTVDWILDWAHGDINTQRNIWLQNKAVADSRGVELIAYEGGQHMAGVGAWLSDPNVTSKFVAANRHYRMSAIYRDYLTKWWQDGTGVMMLFSDMSPYNQWGCWGLTDNALIESILNSGKYIGTWDFWRRADTWVDYNYRQATTTGTPAKPFRSVNLANEWVLDGGTIHVRTGSGRDTVTISRPVKLQPENGPIAIGAGGPLLSKSSGGTGQWTTSSGFAYEDSPVVDEFSTKTGLLQTSTTGGKSLAEGGETKLRTSPPPGSATAIGSISIEQGGITQASVDSPLVVRLYHSTIIDPDTIEVFVSDYDVNALDVSWEEVIAGDMRDLWIVIRNDNSWLLDDVIEISAQARGVDGSSVSTGVQTFVTGNFETYTGNQASLAELGTTTLAKSDQK